MGSIVGVDVGATGIRAVEVAGSGQAPAVRRAWAVPLRPDAVQGGVVKDAAAVTAALKELWKKGNFVSKNVALVIGGNQQVLMNRGAVVMWMDDPMLFRGVVAEEAGKELPVALDKVYFDYHVLSVRDAPTKDNPSRRDANVMVIGAVREVVDTLVATVEAAGLHPVGVDTAPFALTRLVSTAGSGPNKLDFIIHFGADVVMLVGIVNGQPMYARTMNEYCGQAITLQMQDTFDLTRERAEAVKLDASADLELGIDSDVTNIINASVSAITREARSTITDAVRRINLPIGRVWLSGGGARLGGLSTRLTAELGAPVMVLDPKSWTTKPAKLVAAASTGQDFTLALAAGGH